MVLENTFYYIGAAASLYLLACLVQHLFTFLHPSSLPRYLHKGKESWALITGATDGIGFGFAQELCQRGFNVLLHGRNRQKLMRVEAQLKSDFPSSKIRTFIFDASQPTGSIDELVRDFEDINLTILINNVGGQGGQTSSTFQLFRDFANHEVDRVIDVNARFATQLTRALLPNLERNEPSLIMNLSSTSALGLPYLSVYSGSKGYIESFTKALNTEMKAEGKDIDVIGIKVGSVQSAGNDVQLGFFIPTSRQMASASLNRVGCGRALISAYWPHFLQTLGFEIIHEKVMQAVVIDALKKRKIETDQREKRRN
jgi:short-subunit dehydrogenase